jgi:hypothetical protein
MPKKQQAVVPLVSAHRIERAQLSPEEARGLIFHSGISKPKGRGGRRFAPTHADLARRPDELEKKYDQQFAAMFDAIRQLMAPPRPQQREMGYHTLIEKRAAE